MLRGKAQFFHMPCAGNLKSFAFLDQGGLKYVTQFVQSLLFIVGIRLVRTPLTSSFCLI